MAFEISIFGDESRECLDEHLVTQQWFWAYNSSFPRLERRLSEKLKYAAYLLLLDFVRTHATSLLTISRMSSIYFSLQRLLSMFFEMEQQWSKKRSKKNITKIPKSPTTAKNKTLMSSQPISEAGHNLQCSQTCCFMYISVLIDISD